MAIDKRDRIFVIESHTHHPPADYAGPKSDRIKLLIDTNGDVGFSDILALIGLWGDCPPG